MKDFYHKLDIAINENEVGKLIKTYRGDSTLTYQVNPSPIRMDEKASESLSEIYNKSLGQFPYKQEDGEEGLFLAQEIAFTGIIDEDHRLIKDFIMGETGSKDMCDWDEGNLMELSYEKAKESNSKIVLGHTHPVIFPLKGEKRQYGALPSCISYTKKDITKYVLDTKISDSMLKSKVYEKYWGDYCELFTRAKEIDEVSNFAMIVSPALDQFGIFEVKKKGRVIYHPLKIGN